MNKTRLLVIAVIVLMILNLMLIGLIFSHPPHPGRPMDDDEDHTAPKYLIIEKLGLNETQQHQYDSLIQIHQDNLNAIENDISHKKADLYHGLQHPEMQLPDSILHQLSFDFTKVERTHYDHFNALRNICRSDQLNAFNELTNELLDIFAPEK